MKKTLSSSSPSPSATRQKQLLFDRRYGWVYEEWTDPVEVANMGGRGIGFGKFSRIQLDRFSLIPLTASALDGSLHLANRAADVVVQALQNRETILMQLRCTVTACGDQLRGLGGMTSNQLKVLGERTSNQWKVLGKKKTDRESYE